MMIVWRIRGEIIRTVLCCVVLCTTVVHSDTHTRKQFLSLALRFCFCVFV